MADVVVVGGGVFGLWCARACVGAGLSVALADRARPGAGASGGPVGALAPHDPLDWSPLKALQLEGLLALPREVDALEAETGRSTGHARPGRLRPLRSEGARARVAAQAAAAKTRWAGAGEIRLLDAPPADAPSLAPEAAPFGWALDTLSGRIDPPAYLAALAASLEGRAERLDGWRFLRAEPGAAVFDRGRVAAGQVVIAAGWESLALAGLAGGEGVKGQAAVLGATLPAGAPLLTAPGLFVAAHGPGRVAVGSTAEPGRTDTETDGRLDGVIAKARALCPALAEAPIRARWAGVRPRAPGGLPVVGRLPDRPEVLLATGGFRIGLALAHLVGRAAAAEIAGRGGTLTGVARPGRLPPETARLPP
jgi:glycine/D-amino acid oxidase-like deaminating enzyme